MDLIQFPVDVWIKYVEQLAAGPPVEDIYALIFNLHMNFFIIRSPAALIVLFYAPYDDASADRSKGLRSKKNEATTHKTWGALNVTYYVRASSFRNQ